MRRIFKNVLLICLCLALFSGFALPCRAADFPEETLLADTAARLYEMVPSPGVGSVGGEWAVIGLARSDTSVPEGYFEGYYAALCVCVKAGGGELSDRKYTEYARVVLALTALGADPTDVAGYDLIAPLGDYDKTVWQGINGPVWALIALDSGGYDMPAAPEGKTQATRDMYIDAILKAQLRDGGFSLAAGGSADADITGMALQALSKYTDREEVGAAVERALTRLSKLQRKDGSYETGGVATLESTAQVTVALCELGIPLDDDRFVKEGGSLADGLMCFYGGDGSFRHDLTDGGDDLMATEQAFYALVAVSRARKGRQSLYRMGDAALRLGAGGAALPGRHPDVVPQPIRFDGITFSDILESKCHKAVEGLAARGIVTGRGDGTYDPDGTMTRAEFCAAVVRALGLVPQADGRFSDVGPEQWYAGYVGTAARYGIVNGVTETNFSPALTITRQEAAAMLARAAKLTGLDTDFGGDAADRVLAAFDDGRLVDVWAKEALSFCYSIGIYDDSEMEIRPKAAITRAEIAQALYDLLSTANFL